MDSYLLLCHVMNYYEYDYRAHVQKRILSNKLNSIVDSRSLTSSKSFHQLLVEKILVPL